jgi:hypothetical protein
MQPTPNVWRWRPRPRTPLASQLGVHRQTPTISLFDFPISRPLPDHWMIDEMIGDHEHGKPRSAQQTSLF